MFASLVVFSIFSLLIGVEVEVCEAIPGTCTHEAKVNYASNDIRDIRVKDLKACDDACLQEENCVGTAFHTWQHRCWLKKKMVNGSPHGDFITSHCLKKDFHPTACWHGSADAFDLKTVKEVFDAYGTHKSLRSYSLAKEVIHVLRKAYNKRPIQKDHPIRLIHLVLPGWFQNIQYLGKTKCVNYKDVNALIHW